MLLKHRIVCSLFAALALASLSVVGSASEPPGKETPSFSVSSCIVGAGPDGRLGLEVTFENTSQAPYRSLVWRAHLGRGWLDFRDNGDFAPGQSQKRVIYWRGAYATGIYNNNGDCSVVAAETDAGANWSSPGFSSSETFSMPTPRPSDATAVPSTIDNAINDPIGIVSCAVDVESGRSHGLGRKAGLGVLKVRFRNLSTRMIDRVIFRAAYLRSGVDFTYGGHFSPNELISSDEYVFGTRIPGGHLMEDMPVGTSISFASLDDDPGNCMTVSAHYEDGETWQNPNVGQTPPPLPTAPPTLPPN